MMPRLKVETLPIQGRRHRAARSHSMVFNRGIEMTQF